MSTATRQPVRETRVIKVDDKFILFNFRCPMCGHESLWQIPRDREGRPFDCPEECGARFICWRPELEFVVAEYPLPDEKPGPDHKHNWGGSGGCWCGARQCAARSTAWEGLLRCTQPAAGDEGKCAQHTTDPTIRKGVA